MKPELLSQCMTTWMAEKDVSVADLTSMVGYKSKTSVFRLLKDQCNEQTMVSFVDLMLPHLDEAWIARFKKALRVEKYGLQKYRMFESMMECIHNLQQPTANNVSTLMPTEGKDILILGQPYKRTSSVIRQMLHDGYHITHYVERKAIHTIPDILQSIITNIDSHDYQALMIDEKPSSAWHLMTTDAGQLFLNGRWYSVSGGQDLFSSLRPESGTPLYRFADLHKGDDYIEFMEKAYWLESGGTAVVAKQTPGIQMMPEDIVLSAFTDYLFDQVEPISAALGSLRLLLRKRIDNFYQRKKPVTIVFDQKSMMKFMQTGITSDHFYACRPYTLDERFRIIRALYDFSKQDNVTMLVVDGNPWNFSMEAYENRGLLFYPADTKYNSQVDNYRELFLPGQEFFTFFWDLTNEMVLQGRNLESTKTWMEQIMA